ncbi:MAG TPA: nitroreductase [Nitrospirota bacterium]|nr:nitroreductase [Nitrospirota bacterium]
MNVIDALHSRFTVRSFMTAPVSRDTLRKILEAALHAPSWANTQPWEIYVAGGDVLNRLRKAYLEHLKNCVPRNPDLEAPREWPPDLQKRMEAVKAERIAAVERACLDTPTLVDVAHINYRFFDAPVVVYLCMDRRLTPWSIFDLGLVAQSIMLAAQEFNVASAPAVTLVAHPELIRAELDIPDDLLIIIGVALGYADSKHPLNTFRSPRRPIDEAIKFRGL